MAAFLLDAALIPLIEDLFKELAMIEACNKVRKERCELWHYSHCESPVHDSISSCRLSGWCLISLSPRGASLDCIIIGAFAQMFCLFRQVRRAVVSCI